MLQSVEFYFLMNFALDAALIAVVSRANGCMQLSRTLAAGLLGASYAVLVEVVTPRLAHPAIQLALAALLTLIVCGDPSPRRWISIAFQLFCGILLLGGIGQLAPHGSRISLTIALCAGLLLIHLLLTVRNNRIESWEVTLSLRYRGKCVSFKALIDTGNRLREPISGLPVLIAESSLLRNLLPDGADESIPCRQIAFGSLGGGGMVRCFHPDTVLIRRGNRLVQAPEVWVAVYPGKIPGVSRALAPPSFAVIPGKT